MVLTISGIEASKPQLNNTTGKAKLVRLSDGSGLLLHIADASKQCSARALWEKRTHALSAGKLKHP